MTTDDKGTPPSGWVWCEAPRCRSRLRPNGRWKKCAHCEPRPRPPQKPHRMRDESKQRAKRRYLARGVPAGWTV